MIERLDKIITNVTYHTYFFSHGHKDSIQAAVLILVLLLTYYLFWTKKNHIERNIILVGFIVCNIVLVLYAIRNNYHWGQSLLQYMSFGPLYLIFMDVIYFIFMKNYKEDIKRKIGFSLLFLVSCLLFSITFILGELLPVYAIIDWGN